MDSLNSFKGYGKVNEQEERDFRRKTCKRYAIIGASVVILLVIVVGGVVGTQVINKKKGNSGDGAPPPSVAQSIKAVCSVTLYPDSCFSSIESMNSSQKWDPEELFRLSMKVAIDELSKISSLPEILKSKASDKVVKAAIDDCKGLFEDAIDQLNSSLSSIQPVGSDENILSAEKLDDLKTWLSTAVTDQETCLDGIGEVSAEFRTQMASLLKNSTQFTSNSLAIAAKIISVLQKLDIPIHRKLLGVDFPAWVATKDRKLLQATQPTPDVVVARDGSGNFSTIQEAVEKVPKKNLMKRFVILIKAGTYVENVVVDKSKWNVMMVGEGQGKTIISGSLNVVDGTPTFRTATVIAVGRNFIARDMTIINTAGPGKHQAVALRSGSDHSVFYRCTLDAYQDTLYAHSQRQFYRDCTILGTVDFIFGNAAAVFQGCLIQPRQPDPNQKNTVTAQGKVDPNQNTGISIQACTISAFGKVNVPTFLGRPWKAYSTTVIMQSRISSLVDPAGWLPWTLNDPPPTIFYAEYMNNGPGSNLTSRVKWAGYKPALSGDEAEKFTVNSFIQGGEWLPATGITFGESL